jgi:hypothetical protein
MLVIKSLTDPNFSQAGEHVQWQLSVILVMRQRPVPQPTPATVTINGSTPHVYNKVIRVSHQTSLKITGLGPADDVTFFVKQDPSSTKNPRHPFAQQP